VRIVAVGRAVARRASRSPASSRRAAARPALALAHVGGGNKLAALKSLAEDLGIASKVAFLGARAQPDIIALLREADIFALPAKDTASGDRDGLPNVLMEAASQALALVSTRFAGIPEFVRENRDGILVPPGDWEALSNALNGLARDPEQRAALGRSAYSRLTSAFRAEAGFDRLASRLSGRTEPATSRLEAAAE
jgi:glycosyltransferase involved in cell wall biosynthesis